MLCKDVELAAKQDDRDGVAAYREHLVQEYETLHAAVSNIG